jgi:hypothetical protein
MSPEERAREWWLEHGECRRVTCHACQARVASLTQLLQDYGDQRAREAREEALEEAANLVQERKHVVGLFNDDADNFTRDWNDGRTYAYQDAENRIRSLAHKERP